MPVRRNPLRGQGVPVRTAICHCDDCRKATSSAFATSVFANAADLAIKDTPKQFQHITDTSPTMTKEFCANCGSQFFGFSSRGPTIRQVKVGTIDDASFVNPQIEVYKIRKLPNVGLSDETVRFEKERPPS